jgi:hypothetical protein
MKQSLFLLSLIILISLGCSSGKNDSSPVDKQQSDSLITQTKCDDGSEIPFGEYTASNNVWGKGTITDYHQCIQLSTNDTAAIWNWYWNWPAAGEGNVKAYPEIIYGWKPFNNRSTTAKLPLPLTENHSISIRWKSISTEMAGTGNLAFDIWITNSATPGEQNITREIMIWLNNFGQQPGGTLVTKPSIDSVQYSFYKADWTWTYFAFVKTSQTEVHEIRLESILRFLIDNKYISSNEYLAAIEFGNEIVSGSGKTTVDGYSIDIK